MAGRALLLPSNVGPPAVAIWGCSGESPKDPGAGMAGVPDGETWAVPEPLVLELPLLEPLVLAPLVLAPPVLEPPVLEPLVLEPLLEVCDAGELVPVATAGAVPPPPPPLEQADRQALHSAARTVILGESVLRIETSKSERNEIATMLTNAARLGGEPRRHYR